MKKVLVIDICNKCTHFENNMYIGPCCWNSMIKLIPNNKTPKPIQTQSDNNITIPTWCPLNDYKE